MTKQSEYESKIERLRAVVSAYGGDTTRWPVRDQGDLLDLVESDAEAITILRDGQQFDRLLDAADGSDARNEDDPGFADRIFSAVTKDGQVEPVPSQPQKQSDNVVDFTSRRASPAQVNAADDQVVSRAGWLSAAALAASLVLGVVIGANGYVESATTGISEMAGLMSQIETLQIEDGFGPVEEDYL